MNDQRKISLNKTRKYKTWTKKTWRKSRKNIMVSRVISTQTPPKSIKEDST